MVVDVAVLRQDLLERIPGVQFSVQTVQRGSFGNRQLRGICVVLFLLITVLLLLFLLLDLGMGFLLVLVVDELGEEVFDFLVVVDDVEVFIGLLGLDDLQVLEEFVHVFGTELEMLLHLLDPLLVHLVVVGLDEFSHLEVVDGQVFVQVELDDVGDQQQRQLDFLRIVVVLAVLRQSPEVLDVGVQTALDDLPLHLLHRRPQEQNLQLVQHHDLGDLH